MISQSDGDPAQERLHDRAAYAAMRRQVSSFPPSNHPAAALFHRAPHTTAIRFSFAMGILRLRQGTARQEESEFRRAAALLEAAEAVREARVGLGRTLALCHRSPTLYQLH